MAPTPATKSLPAGGSRNESGFTLIEMLTAIAISAILMGVIAQFTFSTAQIWRKNDRSYQRQHLMRLIFTTLNRDFTNVFSSPYLPEPALKGTDREVSFWQETAEGVVQIKYRFDEGSQKVFRSKGFWGCEAEEKELFEGITDWKLEYFQPSSKNWLMEWEPERPADLPPAVRIGVMTKQGAVGPITIPLHAWHPEVKTDEQGQ